MVCDVFTDRALTGNQLAVFTQAADIPDERLQPLAREINFSETVFVYPPDAGADFRIRIFTPKAEVPFAGHPIQGPGFVLASPERDDIRLQTVPGIVPIRSKRESGRQPPPLPCPAGRGNLNLHSAQAEGTNPPSELGLESVRGSGSSAWRDPSSSRR